MRRLVLIIVLACVGGAVAPVDAQPAQPAQTVMPERKIDDTTWRGPSGYWTNPHPAKGGAYRWRMMAIGGVVLLITAYAVWRLVKSAKR